MDARIRGASPKDEDAIWEIIRRVIETGDTYSFPPHLPRQEALDYWCHQPNTHTFVVEMPSEETAATVIVATYILKPNQPGQGAHVSNAAFMVLPSHQRMGLGRKMALDCLLRARNHGFLAMQFNFVVSTNTPAVRLWTDLGFQIVGNLPKAFQHPQFGLVDVFVMHLFLSEEPKEETTELI